jgi:DNA-binding transcriptional MerR regulator/methylmalonyl-CoA mutase cobalamin-binding subunit
MSYQTEHDLVPIGQVVAELQGVYPDVTHSSLRFLEREALLTPARTPGGHRLYAPRDVQRIRQIKTWQAQRLSLEEIRRRLAALEALGPAAEIVHEFLRHATRGDLAAATQAVLHADDLGMPLSQLFQDVLTPALYEIGERWARGELPVGQEKEISELARDLIAELSLRHAHPDPHGPIVVAACVEGEHHDLGLRMVCGLLQARGWQVHFLGADVAPRFLLEAVQLHHPAVVLLSAMLDSRLPAIAAAIEAVEASDPAAGAPAIVIGGRVATDHEATLRAWRVVLAAADRLDVALDETLTDLAPAGTTV